MLLVQQSRLSQPKMKSSSVQKNVNQTLSLNSRKITLKSLPGVMLRDFDGWYAADLGVTLTSSKLSAWASQVPGGPSLIQGVAAKRPAIAEINGLVAIDFDGAVGGKTANPDFIRDNPAATLMDDIGTGDFYFGFVLSAHDTDGDPATQVFFGKELPFSGGVLQEFQLKYANTRLDISMGSSSLANTATGILTANEATFVEFHRLNGTLQIFKNGTSVASESDSTDITANGIMALGTPAQGVNNPFNGLIGEFICKIGTVPVKTRQVIEALMATKWNLGAQVTAKASGRASGFNSLPASNKFRNRPPTF